MTRILITILTISLLFAACAQNENDEITLSIANNHEQSESFKLNDFFGESDLLDNCVDSIFNELNAHQRVAQLIMPAIGEHGQTEATIDKLVLGGKIGGLLMLNGTKSKFTEWISKYNHWNDSLNRLSFSSILLIMLALH